MFRRFGSRVTVIQRGPRLLGHEDADVADAVAELLREDGVEILLGTSTQRVDPGVRLTLNDRVIEGSHLLAAVGRVPNTDVLNPAAGGIQLDDKGFVRTNERLETNVPGIYALGDVRPGPAFTHISYDDYRIIKANLLDGGSRTIAGRVVPYTVFIDPQLGRIGMSEDEARASGRKFKVCKMPMNYVARALEVDESRGFMKAIVDDESGQILGAAILGLEGGELMAMLEIAMLGHVSFDVLRDAIFAHPTLAESFNNLFSQ